MTAGLGFALYLGLSASPSAPGHMTDDPVRHALSDNILILADPELDAIQAENAASRSSPYVPAEQKITEAAAPHSNATPSISRSITIGRGDTLIDALLKAGADRLDAHGAITALSDLFDPRHLRIGQAIDLVFSQDGEKQALNVMALRTRFDERVVAERTEDGDFRAKRQSMAVTPLLGYGSGTIKDSLYLSAQRSGIPAKIIVELIRLYSFDVDFQREIRAGDQFEVLYERDIAEEDGLLEDGNILYARLKLSNRDIPLYRHTPKDSDDADYFNAEGKSVRKALMKTPLDGARLTSRFGKRKHPVLGYVRSHRGADFGAPTGTPIYAAGDGIIERASRYGSYGNYVRIRHNGTYKTAYAHLSKYGSGIRKGVRVKQGQIIGYVGATGRVTAAHLHYEVYVGKERVDPLTLDLPSGRELSGQYLDAFVQARAQQDKDIATLSQTLSIALAARRHDKTDEAP